MATGVLKDATIFLAQFDVTGDHNSIRVPLSVEALDRTTFGDSTRRYVGGLITSTITGEGFVDYGSGTIEDILQARLGLANIPFTVTPDGVANSRALFTQALLARTDVLGGTVGELHRFGITAEPSSAPLVRGTLMAAKAARTSSSNSGTAQQLGAVSATQRVWAALHVFAASGSSPTLAVTVRSDNAVGFASPTTQITFTTATGVTSQISSAAGAITDDYWRVDWTVGGTTPSFTFAVVVGIA